MFPRILLVNNWKHSIPTSTITKANQGHELSRAVTSCHELSRAVTSCPGFPVPAADLTVDCFRSSFLNLSRVSWTSQSLPRMATICHLSTKLASWNSEMCHFSEMNHFKLFEILGKKITWIWGNDGKCLIFAVQGASQWAAQWLVYPSFWRHRLGRENSRWPVAGWTGHVGHQVPGKSSNWWSL